MRRGALSFFFSCFYLLCGSMTRSLSTCYAHGLLSRNPRSMDVSQHLREELGQAFNFTMWYLKNQTTETTTSSWKFRVLSQSYNTTFNVWDFVFNNRKADDRKSSNTELNYLFDRGHGLEDSQIIWIWEHDPSPRIKKIVKKRGNLTKVLSDMTGNLDREDITDRKQVFYV